MFKYIFALYFALYVLSVRCYVFNNIDLTAMQDDVEEEFLNELTEEELAAMQRISLIYPGTKWCGAGNIAENYDDLGVKTEVDKCCREHDYCPDVILAGETKHNLTNTAFYTRLHCDCDEEFRACLHQVGSRTARVIGKMYFNAIGTKCYRKDYPITGCAKRGGWLNTKCVEYTFDTESEQIYQWFDVPNY